MAPSAFLTSIILGILVVVLGVRVWRSRQLPVALRPGAWTLTAGVAFITLTFATAYTFREPLDDLTPRLGELVFRIGSLCAGACLLAHLGYRSGRSSSSLRLGASIAAVSAVALTALWIAGPRIPDPVPGRAWAESPEANDVVTAFVIVYDIAMIAWILPVAAHCGRAARHAWRRRAHHADGVSMVPVAAGQGTMWAAAIVMIAAITATILRALNLQVVQVQGGSLGTFSGIVLPLAAIILGSIGVLIPVVTAAIQARTRIRSLTQLLAQIAPSASPPAPHRWDPSYTLRVLRLRVHDALEVVDLCDHAAMQVASASNPVAALGSVLAHPDQWRRAAGDVDPSWPASMYLPQVHSESGQLVQQLELADALHRQTAGRAA